VPNQPLVKSLETGASTAVATGTRSALANRFLELVADKLIATEAVFRHHLDSDVPFIHMTGEYISLSGGKRVRPALLLLAARLLGHDGDEEVTYAAVVELIHTATLIHDDIIDHATLRRGQRTLNHLWGNNLTVLLGDWIYTKAMQMALSHGQVEIIQRLCGATLKMTEGELLAFQRLGAPDLSVEEYFEIIDRKTAHLFAAAASIPSLIPPQRPEAGQVLTRYGRSLGICFQLVDDLLDFTADQVALGKPVGGDLREGKVTLPVIFLLQRGGQEADRLIRRVVQDRAVSPEQWREIVALLREHRATGLAYDRAVEYANRAKGCLAAFPPSRERDALMALPDYVLARDR